MTEILRCKTLSKTMVEGDDGKRYTINHSTYILIHPDNLHEVSDVD